jgi:hypothetical protein
MKRRDQDRKNCESSALASHPDFASETATNVKTAKTPPGVFCGLNPDPQKSWRKASIGSAPARESFCGLNPDPWAAPGPWFGDLLTLASDADWRSKFAHLVARYAPVAGSIPEARRWAWADLQNRWRIVHGERLRRDRCAGCGQEFGSAPFLDLIDGNRVHVDEKYACLARFTRRWRRDARRALRAMGIAEPAEVD